MRLVLFEPEIPPNAGNVARLCAATKTALHFIEPLGFKIDDKHLKRAGLDYWPNVNLTVHDDWEAFRNAHPGRLILSSARCGVNWCDFEYAPDDLIVLGPETRGLPDGIMKQSPHHVRIPVYDTVRSLNMSTAAGILLMEALRQTGSSCANTLCGLHLPASSHSTPFSRSEAIELIHFTKRKADRPCATGHAKL